MRWERQIAHTRESIGTYSILAGILEGKRQLVNSRRRWEDNIVMEVQ
jgi:hypothetical protein